jgi:hypothetical protein
MTRPTICADTSSPEDHTLRDLIPAYEKARAALAKAKSLDEVKSIPKEFDRLRAADRIVEDFEFELMLAEIKLREVRRIGEISRGLEKSKGGRKRTSSDDGKSSFKQATLEKASISKSRAYRAEKVAAIEQHHFDKYLKEAAGRGSRSPSTICWKPSPPASGWPTSMAVVWTLGPQNGKHPVRRSSARPSVHWTKFYSRWNASAATSLLP